MRGKTLARRGAPGSWTIRHGLFARFPRLVYHRMPLIAACRALFACWVALALPAYAFDLQGHRGARGLMPENSLAAFQHALELGVTTLELDIAITADGVPVISHDPALNPALTRDAQGRWLTHVPPPCGLRCEPLGSGPAGLTGTPPPCGLRCEPLGSGPAGLMRQGPLIKSLTLAQLQDYDIGRTDPQSAYGRQFPQQQARDGQRIPTLAALFKLVNELGATEVRFDIETKVFPTRPGDTLGPEAFVNTLLRVIRAAGMSQRVMVQSFDWRTLQYLQKLEPGMETVYLTSQSRSLDNVRDSAWTGGMLWRDYASVAHMVKASGGSTWSPNFNNIDAAAVKAAQQLGLKVIPWTVNEAADMDRLIAWGVDGIISDYPDRLREAMRRAGLPLPRGLKN